MTFKEKQSVQKVVQALKAAGLGDRVMELAETAKTVDDVAAAVGCEVGAVVQSLTFNVGDRAVLALVSGDHRCAEDNLARALNLEGKVSKPQAQRVKDMTGFAVGGVAPLGLPDDMSVVIDASLRRFETVYAPAGHPHCLFPASFADLKRLTGGVVSYNIATPVDPDAVPQPKFERSRTFRKQAAEAGGTPATGENTGD